MLVNQGFHVFFRFGKAVPSPVHFTVLDHFEYWLKTYRFQKLKPLSYDCPEGSVQNPIFPRLGKMNFGSVSRDDSQRDYAVLFFLVLIYTL